MEIHCLSRKQTTLIFQRFSYLLILVIISASCDWNSRTNKNSEKAESVPITKVDSGYVVDVTAVDYAFGMPSEIPSGWVTFRMKNMGKEEHLGIVEKYPDSLGYDGLTAMISEALKQDGMEGFLPMMNIREGQYGGPAMLSPGLTGETTVYLDPGLYAFTCWVKTPDGEYHLQRGMIRPFKITTDKSGADKPNSTVNITMSDFAINIEDSIGKGEQVFNVKFNGMHNIHMARLEPDQDLEDFKEWMNHITAPSPFTFIGGAEQAQEGMTSTFKATLEPGRYAFGTFGRTMYGMVEEINIPENGTAPPSSVQDTDSTIVIESGSEEILIPENIKVGRTILVVKNSGKEDYAYNFVLVKEGHSPEEVEEYFKAAFVDKTINPQMVPQPFYHIWSKVIEPGEEKEFRLNVEEEHYVFIGPVSMEGTEESAFNKENLFHGIEGGTN